ncbi:DUF2927 domain-containing protein [Gymnodinialimonas hymeniacidonis]|uniref:DUF2927 domain-containing protein n=1 Tax=Gymnodinialimonas hymeniacidonis TaxID=3126508 RepID=UPI0034C60261
MFRKLSRLIPVAALVLAACAPTTGADVAERRVAALPEALPPMNTFGQARAQAPSRSNSSIAADFLDLSFQMESGRLIERMSRFEGPVTVAITGSVPASMSADLDQLLARLRSEAGISITRVSSDASITIETMPRARMQRVVPQAACFVVPRVSSWAEFRRNRSGGTLDWTTLDTRERVAVFIPSDVAPQEMRDCLHEEIAQALGPLNDLYRLSDSVFNDDNFNAVLTGFDMLILRAYYDDELQSGLTRGEVAARLPGILSRLNPRGGSAQGGGRGSQTPRPWISAIETALGPGSSDNARIAAAERAVRLARNQNWNDTRTAFAYFALGRLTLSRDVEASIQAFQQASVLFDRVAPGGIQSAHVDMQLAAFALSAGQVDEALTLTARAMPAATRAQNASLLSTLMMIRAEALEDAGRPSEARSVRLDSLAWGRYGFGGQSAVGARLTEVAALSPGQ